MTTAAGAETAGGASRRREHLPVWLAALALLVLLPYAWIHARVIADPLPVAVREAAFILQTEALLDPAAPPMYAWAGQPENANLYGPLYPLLVAPAVRLAPAHPYGAHRVMVGIFLLTGAVLLGVAVARGGGSAQGVVAGVWYYVAQVATPSIAAGPDLLATLFYVGALVVVGRWGWGWRPVVASLALGLAGLLTKPYTVLVVPGLLTYLFLFVSPRRGLLAGLGTALVVAVGGWALASIWPAYFFSVFDLHATFASRVLSELRHQVQEFSMLNFALLGLLVPLLGAAGRRNAWTVLPPWTRRWNAPLVVAPPRWPAWMVLLAAVALLGSLGWHGGAFLIYFNHLLLPPLLLLTLGGAPMLSAPTRWPWRPLLLVANLAWLGWLRPAVPEIQPLPLFRATDRVLVDPVLEPVARQQAGIDVVEGGQTEYLVIHALTQADGPALAAANRWEQQLAARLHGGAYDYLVLGNYYNRRMLMMKGEPTEFLLQHYELVGYQSVRPYFLSFRQRDRYGRNEARLAIWRHRPAAGGPE